MQRVALYTVVLTGDSRIGIIRRSHSDLMFAGKTQPYTKTILKLKGTTEVIIFNFETGE